MHEKVKKFWPISLILVLAFLLRLYKLEEFFYFTYDESIPAFVGRRLILWNHVPLIGGVTPFGVHLGPYFYWFLSAVLYVGKLNPLSWGVAGALISTLTAFLMFEVGKDLGGKKMGLTAAAFWSFSYLANVYDRHMWALYWGPVISLVALLCLIKIIKGNIRFVYPLSAALAFSMHADPSNLVFFPFVAVAWLIYKLPINKHVLTAVSLIILSLVPLAVFDLKHNFANTKPFINYMQTKRDAKKADFQPLEKFTQTSTVFPVAVSRLIYTFGDTEISKQYAYCKAYIKERFNTVPAYAVFLSSVFLVVFTAWGFTKRKLNPGWFLISLLVAIYFFGLQVYGTLANADVFEHYITGLFAVFLLMLAKLLSIFPKGVWLTLLAAFIFFNLYKLASTTSAQGLTVKRQAIEYTLSKTTGEDFSLDSLSTCWKYNGYRYLFAIYGKEPVKSYVDPNFAYLYGTTPVSKTHPATIAAFVVHDFLPETGDFYKRYGLLKSHEKESAIFGAIEVIILDNSANWFESSTNVN